MKSAVVNETGIGLNAMLTRKWDSQPLILCCIVALENYLSIVGSCCKCKIRLLSYSYFNTVSIGWIAVMMCNAPAEVVIGIYVVRISIFISRFVKLHPPTHTHTVCYEFFYYN